MGKVIQLPAGAPQVDAFTKRQSALSLAKADPLLWTMLYRRLKGQKYVFDLHHEMGKAIHEATPKQLLRHRPFLKQPLTDMSRHKVYKKARQVGVSELSITEVLWFLWSHPNKKWIYTFPRDKQLTDFSTTRIAEAFAETALMRGVIGIPNQIYTKRIGDSFLMLRSAWDSNLGEGIDADGVTFDEKDRMKEGIEVAFKESLSSSAWGLTREVSTPTLPGRGVDAPYALSCQYEWFVKCSKCGKRQTVDYPDNVVQMHEIPYGTSDIPEGTFEYRCRLDKCRGVLNRLDGEWVAAYPNRKDISGYWMPQTICAWLTASELMRKKGEYKFKQLFENYCLGRTSIGENVLLTHQNFEDCIAGYEMPNARGAEWNHIVAGIDWGHLNWVVIMGVNSVNNRKYLLNVAVFEDDQHNELNSVKQIDHFLEPFNPDVIVADAGYGKDRNSYLLKRYPGKVFACSYNTSDKSSRTFKPVWADKDSRVLVDRTMTLKNTCRTIMDKEIGFPIFDKRLGLLIKHFLNLAPMKVEEDGDIYETIDKTGDDHLAHATNYALIALDKIEGSSSSSFSFEFI